MTSDDKIERCCQCDEATGKGGRGEDSLFAADGTPAELGPLCETCYETLTNEKLLLEARAQIASLESMCRDGFNAKQEYEKHMDGCDEPEALERLRFFCSLGLRGQDWLDVEPFFDDMKAQIAARDARIARREAELVSARSIEREACAKLIEPKNDPSDWTEYAKIQAECAARIRGRTELEAELSAISEAHKS